MNNQFGFRKKSIAAAVACALSGAVLAQGQDNTLEEVTVLGVRGAQSSAVNLKRDTLSMVDGIVAEDIGKLPDVTIVDSLQRIPGIQIQRDAGEGAKANIRGLPQVMTLLNGEQYLAAGNLGGAQPTLTDVPSQLMGGVNVYKSTDLDNALSGITGTIDLRTRRPLQFEQGLTSSIAVDAAQGTDTGETDPSVNGLLNWRNEQLGVMVSASQSDANLGNNYAGYSGGVFGNNDWGGSGSNFSAPHGFDSFHRVVERNRTGLNLALEAELGSGFNFVAEGFYTELEEYDRKVGLNISNRWQTLDWLTPTDYSDTGVAGSNGESWLAVDEYDVHAQWVNSFTVNRTSKSDSKNINLELNYDNGGHFRGGLRAIHGEANRLSMNGQAQGDLSNWRDDTPKQLVPFYPADIASRFDVSRYRDDLGVGADGGRFIDPNPLGYGETPELHYSIGGSHPRWSGFDSPIAGGLGAGATMRDYMANVDSYAVAAFSSEGNNESDASLDIFSAKGTYEFEQPAGGFVTRVDFGLRRSDREVEIEQFHLFSRFYGGNGATDVAGCEAQWKAIDVVMNQDQCRAGELVDGEFQGYTVNRPTQLNEYNNVVFVDDYGSVTSGLPGVWAVDPEDFDDVVAFQKRVFGDAYRVIVPGQSYDVGFVEDSFTLSADFEYGIVSGDIGVRVVETEISVRQNLTGAIKNYGDTNIDDGDYHAENDYTDVLPSLNLVVAPRDDLLLRFAASENMMPLDLGNYGGGLKINTQDCPEFGTRCVTSADSSGNPFLDPWRSTNLDAAVEYYFGDASMVNLAVFHVDIESFVVNGAGPKRAFADLDGVVRREVPVTGPIQGEGGNIKGVEVGTKLAFGDFTDGFLGNFGIDTNYTYSPSTQQDEDLKGDKLPFDDNSEHQFNFVAWYQDDRLQARIAYNYRSDRLEDGNIGGTGLQAYQDATSYVDAQVSYDVMDNVTVFLNGSNITGEIENYYLDFAGEDEQYLWQNEFEPRYSLGVRAKF
ncbi:TonB-dependent receptor [Microbulbifer taiwanensis]|uniref:TonB-dependent receptor n=1 Tax=Microbulbifer taiwanensis TaxID=986746 RepID=A0ABW1YPF4_9GAMM|nr:TonB-dependent receptor [Microbulbifer taiwanensis]